MKKYIITSNYEVGGLTGGRSTPYIVQAKTPMDAMRKLSSNCKRVYKSTVDTYTVSHFRGYEQSFGLKKIITGNKYRFEAMEAN